MAATNQFIPRLCHIRKRTDYPGYGFSLRLNEQDGRQHFCRINVNSPAEEAGLLEGDILIEVNDANVEQEAHASVLQRIINSGNEVYLLVVDTETDTFYKAQGDKVTGAMSGIKHMESKPNIRNTNSYGPYGQQQMHPYHAGHDQGPTDLPQVLNPYNVGYNQPYDEQSFGDPAGPYPMTQQPRSPTVIQPIVADNDIPLDLTVPAILVCFCFCWCIGPVGIYFAYKAAEHFRQGDIQQGKRYRINAIVAMVITVIVGIIFAITFSVVRIKR